MPLATVSILPQYISFPILVFALYIFPILLLVFYYPYVEILISKVLADWILCPFYNNLFPQVLKCFTMNSYLMSLSGIIRAWTDLCSSREDLLLHYLGTCVYCTWNHFNLVSQLDHSGRIILNLTPVWMQHKNYRYLEESFITVFFPI